MVSWTLRQRMPPERQSVSQKVHSAIFDKTILLVFSVLRNSYLLYRSILKMQETDSSETSMPIYQNTQHHTAEDHDINICPFENINFHTVIYHKNGEEILPKRRHPSTTVHNAAFQNGRLRCILVCSPVICLDSIRSLLTFSSRLQFRRTAVSRQSMSLA
jgi:hypothetical protein